MEKAALSESFAAGVWCEKVFIATNDYEITGFVFMPKSSKKNRVLSDILNGTRRFVAVKYCVLKNKKNDSEPEKFDFLQVNIDSIIILRPAP